MIAEENPEGRKEVPGMQIINLGSKEAKTFFFGIPLMTATMVLVSVGVGHWLTQLSHIPTKVEVQSPAATVAVHVPQSPAPRVDVAPAIPNIDVHVPGGPAPVINVQPAGVTILERDKEKPKEKIQPAELPAPTAIPVSVPISKEKTSAVSPPAPLPPPKEEEATLDMLYRNAEVYVNSYCVKNGLDPIKESMTWKKKWDGDVEQAIRDGTDTSEQTYINRQVVEKRKNFIMDKASPDQIVEACRILLRYRDGRMQMLDVMNQALTQENIKKTVAFLGQGPKEPNK